MQYESDANESQNPGEAYTHKQGTQYDGVIYTGSVASLELKAGSVPTNVSAVGLINTDYMHDLEVQITDL